MVRPTRLHDLGFPMRGAEGKLPRARYGPSSPHRRIPTEQFIVVPDVSDVLGAAIERDLPFLCET